MVNAALVNPNSMTNHPFENTYNLSDEQLSLLDEAEDLMVKGALGAAEKMLLSMLKADEECIPVLSNLGHLYGRHLSEFETAVEYYDRVLAIEPDNAWARDARRRYLRYIE
jgi:tetratricopeptide (TPR) repeat protein